MRALLQRVGHSEVLVEGKIVGEIQRGLLVYVGISTTDTKSDAVKLAGKVGELRIFDDQQDKLNLSVTDPFVSGAILVIPNFTLMADTRKGRRPSFNPAAKGQTAEQLFDTFVKSLQDSGCQTQQGVFGADMTIRSTALGPVNVIVDYPPEKN
jgi:D-aminoacyl-tRNA deacylase